MNLIRLIWDGGSGEGVGRGRFGLAERWGGGCTRTVKDSDVVGNLQVQMYLRYSDPNRYIMFQSCVCVSACVRACVRVCVCVCICVSK